LAVVSLTASAVASTVALSHSTQTTRYVNHLAKNVFLTLISQEAINKKIEAQIDALESVALLLGNEVQTMKTI
jgi:hypothetical protein